MAKYLIVVDMQNDFIDGALGSKEAVAIVPAVAEKIKARKADNWKIIFTRDTHFSDYLQTNEGRHLPVEHCIEGTVGWEIKPELFEGLEENDYIILNKPTFGTLSWTEVFNYFGERADEIEVVGLCTDICVVSNALILKALYPEIPILVNRNCCAGVTPETHEAALTTMKMCQIEISES